MQGRSTLQSRRDRVKATHKGICTYSAKQCFTHSACSVSDLMTINSDSVIEKIIKNIYIKMAAQQQTLVLTNDHETYFKMSHEHYVILPSSAMLLPYSHSSNSIPFHLYRVS